jgi:hypothetical protein
MEDKLATLLKEALEEVKHIKELYVGQCDFDNAARFRDYGTIIKNLISNVEGADKLITMQKHKVPLNQCRHLELNQKKINWDFKEDLDVRKILDLEAQDMGYKDYEDLELGIISEVGNCGSNCVWWDWRLRIIEERKRKGKSLTQRQPDWNPDDLILPASIKERTNESA